MRASQVRSAILEEHGRIRERLGELESLGRRVLAGEADRLAPLRACARALLLALANHMGFEELHLAAALRAADSWGAERAERLDRDHREQRDLLAHVLTGLEDEGRPPAVLARSLIDLVQLLREDMRSEEEALLDPRILRDDVVLIDLETG
jgi:hypothetical protein